MMTESEKHTIALTVELWNALVALPVEHADDIHEFRSHIHSIQHLVMARPVRRSLS